MRLLICAGGTGGGVYPALAVLDKLKTDGRRKMNDEDVTKDKGRMTNELNPSSTVHPPSSIVHRPSSVLWVGAVGGMEAELVERAGVSFASIPAAGVHGVGWRDMPGNFARLGRGFLAARRLLRRYRPDVLLFTGGYVAVPVALAARTLPGMPRPRILLYVPDIEPGLALKTLSRFSDCIAVTADESRPYFSEAYQSRISVTGYPLRPELKAWSEGAAREFLGISAGLPTLLVIGGSTGCRSINQAVIDALPELLAEMQIVHLTGKLDWPEVDAARSKLDLGQAERYRAFPYLHSEQMGAALSAADLALTRAGASSLGEFPIFGLPAVLVPYPHAWRYQQVNADYLANRGAAVIIKDADLAEKMLPTVRDLLLTRPRALAEMRTGMRALARPDAAQSVADLLWTLADGTTPPGGGDK